MTTPTDEPDVMTAEEVRALARACGYGSPAGNESRIAAGLREAAFRATIAERLRLGGRVAEAEQERDNARAEYVAAVGQRKDAEARAERLAAALRKAEAMWSRHAEDPDEWPAVYEVRAALAEEPSK